MELLWIAVVGVFLGMTVWVFYLNLRTALLIPILRVLHERGVLDVTMIVNAMREKEIYPPAVLKFFVKSVCKSGIKSGMVARRGIEIVHRYAISEKGRMALDEYDWRRGNKKIYE